MPSNKIVDKHVDETLDLFVDFKNRETMKSVPTPVLTVPVVEERDTSDLTLSLKSISGTKVQARIVGGTLAAGTTERIYWLDFGATVDTGEHVEDSVRLRVYSKRPNT